jgi:hypothetical protein
MEALHEQLYGMTRSRPPTTGAKRPLFIAVRQHRSEAVAAEALPESKGPLDLICLRGPGPKELFAPCGGPQWFVAVCYEAGNNSFDPRDRRHNGRKSPRLRHCSGTAPVPAMCQVVGRDIDPGMPRVSVQHQYPQSNLPAVCHFQPSGASETWRATYCSSAKNNAQVRNRSGSPKPLIF